MATDVNHKILGKRKILLVEDVEINQYLARYVLESWGFEIVTANNGRQAVDLVQRDAFDLVLMDIQMPEMDGVEATLQIRALPDANISNIPIVALTANLSKSDTERYVAAGMNDWLAKPFEEDRLFQVIAKNLRDHSSLTNTGVQQAPGTNTGSPEKLYDLSMVEAIAGGDDGFVKRMVQLFLETMPQTLGDLQTQTAAENWQAVGKNAHKLKSTIDSMGIESLKEDIRNIESNGKNNQDVEHLAQLVSKVVLIMGQVVAQIKSDYSL